MLDRSINNFHVTIDVQPAQELSMFPNRPEAFDALSLLREEIRYQPHFKDFNITLPYEGPLMVCKYKGTLLALLFDSSDRHEITAANYDFKDGVQYDDDTLNEGNGSKAESFKATLSEEKSHHETFIRKSLERGILVLCTDVSTLPNEISVYLLTTFLQILEKYFIYDPQFINPDSTFLRKSLKFSSDSAYLNETIRRYLIASLIPGLSTAN